MDWEAGWVCNEPIVWEIADSKQTFVTAAMACLWKRRWFRWGYLPAVCVIFIASYVVVETWDKDWAAVLFLLCPAAIAWPIFSYRDRAKNNYRNIQTHLPLRAWMDADGIGSEQRGRFSWSSVEKAAESGQFFFVLVREPRRMLFIPKASIPGNVDRAREILRERTEFKSTL
ncbi:MAG: hypothetical protein ACP5HU_06295 [Phycisphaerae bacterium]